MTKFTCLILLLFPAFFSGTAFGVDLREVRAHLPHLDLETTGPEYESLLRARVVPQFFQAGEDLQDILGMGKRNLDWLKFINESRDQLHKISFTSAASQEGIPIDSPRKYNPSIIRATYQNLLSHLPAEMKSVLVEGKDFSADVPIDEGQFVEWGRALNKSYEMAARWNLLSPYLGSLEQLKASDVRGYYFLSRDSRRDAEFASWASLDSARRSEMEEWLLGVCANSGTSEDRCTSELGSAVTGGQISTYYSKYVGSAKEQYDYFFAILTPREDVTWFSNDQQMTVPFSDPQNAEIRNFLVNIEDEWKWGYWRLQLNYVTPTANAPSITFSPGVTPHVDRVAGNDIFMDSNAPLTEYNPQWTIRHEFGHVLGFVDCYVEFYDSKMGAIISYQLDTSNLMCSRQGKFQGSHYQELKRVYKTL